MAPAARFAPGDPVKVKFEDRPGHLRTPWYVRGKTGWVERVHGDFRNPESLGFGGDGLPKRALFCVAFNRRDVFGTSDGLRDTILVDIYDHWLEPTARGGGR